MVSPAVNEAHVVHTLASAALNEPRAHAVGRTLPCAQKKPVGHGWHDDAPVALWKYPASHGKHDTDEAAGA